MRFLILSTLILLPLMSVQAMDSKWADKESTTIQKIIEKAGIPLSSLSVHIAGGEGKPTVVKDINGTKMFIPASVTKLVTAATVIRTFPPGTKLKTQLLSAAKIDDVSLKGDLVLKGGGDPSFVSETMWFLVNAFTRNGIKVIEGDLIVDDSLFDSVRYDQSRQKERVDRAYDAPTGAMSFNWNSVNIFVRPGKKSGDPAIVITDPENEYIKLKAKVTTTSGGSASIVTDRDTDKNGGGDTLLVTGKIPLSSPEIVIYNNVTQPDLWSGYNLKSFLAQRGIQVRGKVRAGILPSNAKLLAEADSKSIESMLADMNKFSNNYVAEMLTKNISAASGRPGTLEKGMNAINDYMKSLGVSSNEYYLQNPSGLTRDNKMSAQALWRVLNDLRFQFQYQPEFVTSLPIAGIDGTLKNRMKNTPGERWVRAKTGYLDGVVALAGYAGRRDGTVIPFVLIYNGSADESKVRLLFDKIAISLTE